MSLSDPDAITALRRIRTALELNLDAKVDSRPSRSRPKGEQGYPLVAKTCLPCKTVKARCDGIAGTACPRCEAKGMGDRCEYPVHAKPGRKRKRPASQRLEEALEEVEGLLLRLSLVSGLPAHQSQPRSESSTAVHVQPDLPAGSEVEGEDDDEDNGTDEDEEGVETILANPLAVLAHASPNGESEKLGDGYFSAGGLYQSCSDADPNLDPVRLGLLSEDDLERLLALYFRELRPFFWELDPNLHTSSFLRNVSPFLTTAIAAVAATFCPFSGPLVQGLTSHASYLSLQVMVCGFKSLEVIQAFSFLVHWASPAASWAQDRSWSTLGLAIRIGSELRVDLPLEPREIAQYRRLSGIPDLSVALLEGNRMRCASLLFLSELASASQTGRLQTILSIPGVNGSGARQPQTALESTAGDSTSDHYNYQANDSLNRYFAKALNLSAGLQTEKGPQKADFRAAFNSSWKDHFASWEKRWPDVNHFIQIHYINLRILLLSSSLQFVGPALPILEECRLAADQGARLASQWIHQDHSILYASNYVIVNIAYGATLLLKFMGIKDSRRAPKLDPDIKVVCAKIVETLNMIGSARLHSKSMASLYAARIQTLLDHLDERPSPAQSTSPPNNFDAGFSVTGGIDFDAWCRDNLNSGANEFFSFPVMGELDDMAWFDGGLDGGL